MYKTWVVPFPVTLANAGLAQDAEKMEKSSLYSDYYWEGGQPKEYPH